MHELSCSGFYGGYIEEPDLELKLTPKQLGHI